MNRFLALTDAAVCFARKVWRPLVCLGMGGSLIVNGCIVPLMTKTYPDLIGLATLAVSLAPFAWLRTSEKKAGVS